MQFSPGNKDYWQNGETTWDPRVSEKSINVFWLVFRHQLQKSLWRKLHYWFHTSFFMMSICNYFWLQLEFVVVSLCVCYWMERIHSFSLFLYTCIFMCFFAHSYIVGLWDFKKSSDLLQCLPGFDGGMNQTFHILVKERNTHQVGNNLMMVMRVLVRVLVLEMR